MTRISDWRVGASAMVLAAAVAPLQAQAQDGVDEIIVTAEKREASIQDVPMAVSAFSEQRLDNLQVNDGQDLALVVPSFQFSKQNYATTNIAIRGIGQKLNAVSGDPAVGIHVNGGPLWSSRIFETEFYDVQRVEVLRGPQGTLYGRNASAGVLNIITARPELGEFTGAFEGTVGNFDTVRSRGHVNFPLGDTAALRLAGFVTQREGFTNNLTTGGSLDGRDMYSVRASLGIELSPRDRFFFMAQFFDEESNRSRISKQFCVPDTRAWPYSQGCLPEAPVPGAPTSHASSGGLFTFLPRVHTSLNDNLALYPLGFSSGAVAPPGLRDQAPAFTPSHRAHEEYYQLEYSHDFSSGTFSSLTTYQRDSVLSRVDFNQVRATAPFAATSLAPLGFVTDPYTGSNNVPRSFDESRQVTEQISQELRFVSDLDGPVNFTLGGIHIDMNVFHTTRTFSNTLAYGALLNGVPVAAGFAGGEQNPYELQASAAFGEVYYDFSDDLSLTLGLRYTSDEKSLRNRSTFVLPSNFDPTFRERSVSFEELTGRFGVEWGTRLPFADESNFYAFFSRGYKGGGLNPGDTTSFDPEFVNAIELGVKNTFADGRLRANFTLFDYEYEGYQVGRIVNRSAVNENIDASVRGVEAEFAWAPTESLSFDLNVAWLDTEIADGIRSVNTIDPTNGDPAYTVVKILNTSSNCIVDTAALNALTQIAGTAPGSIVGAASQASLLPGATGQQPIQVAPSAVNPTVLTPAQIAGAAACQVLTTAPSAGQLALVNSIQGMIGRAMLPGSGSTGIAADIGGNRLPNAPEWQLSLGLQWSRDIAADWRMTARTDVFWQDNAYSRIFNGPSDRLDAYSQINAQVRFESEERGLYVALFGKNLEDEAVVTDMFLHDQSAGLFTNAFLLEPRTYGVTLGARW